jgi:hypothetical protein
MLPTVTVVKGSRTPAAAMRLGRGRAAGVGEASGEETAGGLASVLLGDGSMGNWVLAGLVAVE